MICLGLHDLFNETLANNPNVRYTFTVDSQGQVIAQTFEGGFPLGLLAMNSADATDHHHTALIETDEGLVWDTAVPILDGRFGAPGDVLILVSSVNWAVFSVLSRRGLKSHPASLMMLYVMTSGWLFTSALFFAGSGPGELSRLTLNGWIGILFLGVFCSGLAYIAWYDALQSLPAAQTGAFLYIEPLVSVVVAFFVLSEAVRGVSLLGGGIILLGVWLVNRS